MPSAVAMLHMQKRMLAASTANITRFMTDFALLFSMAAVKYSEEELLG